MTKLIIHASQLKFIYCTQFLATFFFVKFKEVENFFSEPKQFYM